MEPNVEQLSEFLSGKSETSLVLFDAFVNKFREVGEIKLHPAKTMIGIVNAEKPVAWVTQFGKGFLHVVFPFDRPYHVNLCFQKIAQVPGDAHQFNHHFRMWSENDLNDELIGFMQKAINGAL